MSRMSFVWLARGKRRELDAFPISFVELALFLLFSLSLCGWTATGLFPEPETERCGGNGRELALNLLAVTACIAEPSTDLPISFGLSI